MSSTEMQNSQSQRELTKIQAWNQLFKKGRQIGKKSQNIYAILI